MWKAEGGGAIWTSPVVLGDVVYVGSTDGVFRAVDRDSGKARWRRQMAGRMCSTPYAAGRLVYVGCSDGRLYALESASGNDAWSFQAADSIVASPAFASGLVLAGRKTHVLRARRGLGQRSMEVRDGSRDSLVRGGRGGKVFFGGKDGYVYALNVTDGRQLWRSESMRTLTAPPVAGEAIVCIQTFYGSTQAFESNTGSATLAIQSRWLPSVHADPDRRCRLPRHIPRRVCMRFADFLPSAFCLLPLLLLTNRYPSN